ncbi:3-dehydroquinate synthase [Luteococcus peritonei]|uniref:3-dehydroquinate synthase n=1 Tax=Luteococcus peritonei TaxID=88874 RepID=A0ABW4RYU3_9ACTN
MAEVEVRAERPYRVQIGAGALSGLPELLQGARRVAILHAGVMADRAHTVAHELAADGLQTTCIEVPDGEGAKTGEVLLHCWDRLAEAGLTRSDVVVGLGGGATTDLAGFVAASWLRGVGFVSIPTTVLAMVDAAVGGKTGINITAGKNLVGAFHEPLGVLCDLDLLVGLPEREVSSGLAEVVKCGFIADERILELVEQDPAEARDVTSVRFATLVRRAVQVKAQTVSTDLREATSSADRVGREALNYGHTLGHAIEAAQHFTWRHGEAISIGMVFAAEVSHRLAGLAADDVARHRRLLSQVGLPTAYNAADWNQLRATMSLDKKARGDQLRMVGLRRMGEVTIVDSPPEQVLLECWQALDPGA